jgi:mRNA interferase RelE/StbE
VKRDVVLTGPARRDLHRLDRDVGDRILRAIARYAETNQGDVRRLHGVRAERRLRVGDWRVRFRLVDADRTIEVLRILPRGRAYRA